MRFPLLLFLLLFVIILNMTSPKGIMKMLEEVAIGFNHFKHWTLNIFHDTQKNSSEKEDSNKFSTPEPPINQFDK